MSDRNQDCTSQCLWYGSRATREVQAKSNEFWEEGWGVSKGLRPRAGLDKVSYSSVQPASQSRMVCPGMPTLAPSVSAHVLAPWNASSLSVLLPLCISWLLNPELGLG